MKTDYAGIDYSNGTANVDFESGIRYGVIPVVSVLQMWADNSEPVYDSKCCYCGYELDEDLFCTGCNEDFSDYMEPSFYKFEDDGYAAMDDEHGDIMIIQSPYYTYAQFCSPCAPGACYLLNEVDSEFSNNKVYCFGHDWFDNGVAPYTVYKVSDNSKVEAG